ncbi:MAG: threonine--tRNA ligase [Candidatus Portnoybacteria bacterium CG10_big_fil_rev_8_21_14_0_10_36_7]|uniref:Threonine--tRNA ligase n=1 Tax=Candidatus Portnoybacteria bacterium CG10_big_fil_rev_8_21_14_0_10_36_7 TaxID=1974812 RepID=A0A2M8KEU3_9BACT|nr:MAG: threonine--tRNA ligase [Candidatus Portnoybacteria bacterium CG10_big_fil_rev_8_21_14_0_10_36_7]
MSKKIEPNELEIKRHSLAHIMASVIEEMFPDAKFAIGPTIEDGFYYDFDLPRTLIPEDLPLIEEKMLALIKKNIPFEKIEVKIDDAIETAKKVGQNYKAELLEQIKSEGEKSVSFYKTDKFVDLCRGPHIASTGKINPRSFKLISIAGAYWRGDEKNKMLQRIYGVAFQNKEELKGYIAQQAEAEKRDHRKIGKELGLFMFSEEIGKGLPLWLPKGAFIRKKLEDYMYETEKANGYDFVYTPVLANENLYKKSGHLSHYKDDMYAPIEIENEKYYLKPMNCPHHHIMYASTNRSYNDLPIRYADFSPIHRHERSGALTGLIRTRSFSQNDAHIYCSKQDVEKEISKVLDMFKKVYNDFHIKNYWFRLSLPNFNDKEKYGDITNKALWEKSANYARKALEKSGEKFDEISGEAAFYGPKIDVQIKNVMGKKDTIATAQVDFYMPTKFDLNFINEKGEKERPFIIHRAIMGSFDRFFAFLVEQTSGHFPIWLSPIQVQIIPVSDKHEDYAKKITNELTESNILVEATKGNETLGKRIRAGQLQKIPYLIIVGDKEINAKSIAVRHREKGDMGSITIDEFIKLVQDEIKQKK